MQVARTYSVWSTILWTRRYIFFLLLISTTFVALYELAGFYWLKIPWLPISVIGIAVAFFVGFKNNSSYGRLWEARMIWGAIVNASRSWGIMVKDFITNEFVKDKLSSDELKKIHKEMIYRHIAWLTTLRYQMRTPRSWEHNNYDQARSHIFYKINELDIPMEEEMSKFLTSEEVREFLSKQNPATQIIARQSEKLKELKLQGLIEDFRHMELQNMLLELYTQQGKSERIKNFPFPRQYATFNLISVWIFAFLLPLGMISTFETIGTGFVWLSIPFSTLIGWVFFTMEEIGDYSENPFEAGVNDVPITSLSRTVEIDLREMLGETDLPPKIEPVNNILS